MALNHGDWIVTSNVRVYEKPIYKEVKRCFIDYFFKCVREYVDKVQIGVETETRKRPYPSTGYRFRMDPVHMIRHWRHTICYHKCALVVQAFQHSRVEYSIGEDDFVFIDKRMEAKYRNSPMNDFDPKWNGRIRSWKRSKIDKQWERKIKRQTKTNTYV